MLRFPLAVVCVAAVLSACSSQDTRVGPNAGSDAGSEAGRLGGPLDDELRLNQIQMLATHNSYHVASDDPAVPDWGYTRRPLDEQLDNGVRGFELDTHFVQGEERIDVYHVPTLDQDTTCELLSDCLAVLKNWSDAHPGHHALFVQIEPKDDEFGRAIDFSRYADRMDQEISRVWPRERIVTPDDVRGEAETLRAAVRDGGWPTLGEVRGRLVLFLNERAQFHEAYTRGGADVSGRVMFPQSDVDEPIGAVAVINTPSSEVTAAVEAGLIVRTRADVFPKPEDAEARRERALESGAQIVTTDFPGSGDGEFSLPGGTPSRCNPVNAPTGCSSVAVEDL